VSGTLGEADLGLQLVRSGFKGAGRERALLRKHLYPKRELHWAVGSAQNVCHGDDGPV